MITLRQFSITALLWIFVFAGNPVWAAANGLQDVGTTAFTDVGANLTSAEYIISGSASLNQDRISSLGKGAYLVTTSTTKQTITVTPNNTTVGSFELTAMTFEEYQTGTSAIFKVWIIGNVMGGGTVGSEASAVTGTANADTYTGALTAQFNGVRLTSFVIHLQSQTSHGADNISLRSFTTANALPPPDLTPPQVTGVTSLTPNAAYTVGSLISIQVSFTENVTVTGTPLLILETGTTDKFATYVSGSGTSTLTFNYFVQPGDTATPLDYVSTLALMLNGGTIRDAANNNANLTLASPGTAGSLAASKNLVIDTTPPTVSISAPSKATTKGEDVTFTVTYTGAAIISLTPINIIIHGIGATVQGIAVTSTPGDSNSRTVTLSGISGNGTVGIFVVSGTAIDAAGNMAAGAGPSLSFTVEPVPSVVTLPATGITVTSALLTAIINANGLPTTAAFESGVDTNYGTVTFATLLPDNSPIPLPASVTLNGLTPGTTYHFRAAATNSIGGKTGADLMFTTAANTFAPIDIMLSATSLAENNALDAIVGTLSALDPDPGDTFTYALVEGDGDTDNDLFKITGSNFQAASSFDYEDRNSYSVRLQATDAGGLTFEKAFTITVTDINEAPSFNGYVFIAVKATPVSVFLAKILTGTEDPEGDVRSIIATDTESEAGGTVELLANSIRYTPPADFIGLDAFEITISDGTLTATGVINVAVGFGSGNGPTLLSIVPVGSEVQLTFASIPGTQYQLQHATELAESATWTTLDNLVGDASGFIRYTHVNPPSPSFWRIILAP